MGFLEGIVLGLAVGVFCPSIARKLKAGFVKESKKVIPLADSIARNAIKKI